MLYQRDALLSQLSTDVQSLGDTPSLGIVSGRSNVPTGRHGRSTRIAENRCRGRKMGRFSKTVRGGHEPGAGEAAPATAATRPASSAPPRRRSLAERSRPRVTSCTNRSARLHGNPHCGNDFGVITSIMEVKVVVDVFISHNGTDVPAHPAPAASARTAGREARTTAWNQVARKYGATAVAGVMLRPCRCRFWICPPQASVTSCGR